MESDFPEKPDWQFVIKCPICKRSIRKFEQPRNEKEFQYMKICGCNLCDEGGSSHASLVGAEIFRRQ